MADQFNKNVTAGTTGGGNIILGFLAGVVAAILGALIWMGVAVGLHLQAGLVAILIGFMVGFAVRLGGHGGSSIYGVMGAVLAFAGCLGGDILATLSAKTSSQESLLDLLKSTDYVALVQIIFANLGVFGYFIYGIAVYEGFKFSMKK